MTNDSKEKTGTTIYVSDEANKALRDLEISFWPFKPKKNSDKILALIHLYNESKK